VESDRSIMVPVCVGNLKYVRRGYVTWAGDGIEYAAEEPSLLKHELLCFRQ
jgi:hypothetical protein